MVVCQGLARLEIGSNMVHLGGGAESRVAGTGGKGRWQCAYEARRVGWSHRVQSNTCHEVVSLRYLEVFKTFHWLEVKREERLAENGGGLV